MKKYFILLLSILFTLYANTGNAQCTVTPPSGYASCIEVTTNADPQITTHVGQTCGSLRWAILYANSNPGATYIKFNIPSGTSKVIGVLSALPTITSKVYIDGTSQPGYNTTTKEPAITLMCGLPEPHWVSKVGVAFYLSSNSDGSTIRGFRFKKFWKTYIMVGSNDISKNLTAITIQDNVFMDKSDLDPCDGSGNNSTYPYIGCKYLPGAGSYDYHWEDIHFMNNASDCFVFGNYFGIDFINGSLSASTWTDQWAHGILLNFDQTWLNPDPQRIKNGLVNNISIGDNNNENRNYFSLGTYIIFSLSPIDAVYPVYPNAGYQNSSNCIVKNNIFLDIHTTYNDYIYDPNDVIRAPIMFEYGVQTDDNIQSDTWNVKRPQILYNSSNVLYGTAKANTNVEIYKLFYDPTLGFDKYVSVGMAQTNENGYWQISSNGLYNPSGTFNINDIYTVISLTGGYNGNSSSMAARYRILYCPTISISGAPFIACRTGGTITLTGTPSGGTFYGTGMTGNVFNPTAVTAPSTAVSIGYTYNSVPNGCPTTANVQINIPPDAQPLTNVLNITASTYNDAWPSDAQVTVADTKPYYMAGIKGMWIPEEQYAYVDDRAQGSTINTRTDGLVQNVAMFNWNSTTNGMCYPNWRKVNTITQVANGTGQLENKDILNNYTAALYGYQDQLSIAVAANAELQEIAYEGFEEYTVGQSLTLSNISKGNFTVLTSVPTTQDLDRVLYFNYDIIQGLNNVITINFPASRAGELYGSLIKVFGAEIFSNTKKTIHGYYSVYKAEAGEDANTCKLTLNPAEFTFYGSWLGKVTLPVNLGKSITPVFSVSSNSVSVVNTVPTDVTRKAHTGKNFLKVISNTEFEQVNTRLLGGQKYVFSAWISADDVNASTYDLTGRSVVIEFIDASGQKISGSATTFTLATNVSNIIEGWQRLEGQFTFPSTAVRYTVKLQTPSGIATYIDDIRIFPADGNIQSYVYDNLSYKLRAVLDQNNYATFYYYDESGALYLLKKETERGVMTIQESYSHMTEINK